METTLNLVWLAVTIAIVYLWRYRWSVLRRDARRNVRHEAVALVCVVALLFPVISLSDDLHPEIVAMDAAGGKRHAGQILSDAAHAHGRAIRRATHVTAGTPSAPLAAITSCFCSFVLQTQFSDPIAVDESSPGRSPPSLSFLNA